MMPDNFYGIVTANEYCFTATAEPPTRQEELESERRELEQRLEQVTRELEGLAV